jgi:hypothetical protein
MRERGLAARRDGRPNELHGYALQALLLIDEAMRLAVRAADVEMATTIYVERGRSLIDLERFDEAEAALEKSLGRDKSRVDAASLVALVDLKRGQAERNRVPLTRPRPAVARAEVEAPVGDEPAGFALDLKELIPATPALSTKDLESAGRGLQSIYRGLHGLLRTEPEPTEEGTTAPGSSSP